MSRQRTVERDHTGVRAISSCSGVYFRCAMSAGVGSAAMIAVGGGMGAVGSAAMIAVRGGDVVVRSDHFCWRLGTLKAGKRKNKALAMV